MVWPRLQTRLLSQPVVHPSLNLNFGMRAIERTQPNKIAAVLLSAIWSLIQSLGESHVAVRIKG